MTTQFRSYKYRLYPTIAQESVLNQFVGAKRWIYNRLLNEQKRRFDSGEKHLSFFDSCKLVTDLKKDQGISWLKSVDDWALKHALEDLNSIS